MKIFKVPNFDKDRQTLLDALLSNFFTVFYGFTMEDKGKKGLLYCLPFLEEIDMSSLAFARKKENIFSLVHHKQAMVFLLGDHPQSTYYVIGEGGVQQKRTQ